MNRSIFCTSFIVFSGFQFSSFSYFLISALDLSSICCNIFLKKNRPASTQHPSLFIHSYILVASVLQTSDSARDSATVLVEGRAADCTLYYSSRVSSATRYFTSVLLLVSTQYA